MRSFSSSSRRATWCRYSGTWTHGDTHTHIRGRLLMSNCIKMTHLHHRYMKGVTHISLLHQPLSLRCIQAIGLNQKSLLKGIFVNLNKSFDMQEVKHWCTFSASTDIFWLTGDQLPAGLTACPIDSWADCGLSSLHCVQVLSAPKCHRLCASALHCHSQCGYETAPAQCPCKEHRKSASYTREAQAVLLNELTCCGLACT